MAVRFAMKTGGRDFVKFSLAAETERMTALLWSSVETVLKGLARMLSQP